jgi:hypothetical protein
MLTSPVTGVPVTGLTSPTYTVAADKAPSPQASQFAVTAIGGTQTGVDTGAAATRPWTATFYKPSAVRQLNSVDSNNVLRNVPNNVYALLVRKGVTVLSGQPSRLFQARTEFLVPAGADVADIPNIKAGYSFFGGVVTQAANNMVSMFTTGLMAS